MYLFPIWVNVNTGLWKLSPYPLLVETVDVWLSMINKRWRKIPNFRCYYLLHSMSFVSFTSFIYCLLLVHVHMLYNMGHFFSQKCGSRKCSIFYFPFFINPWMKHGHMCVFCPFVRYSKLLVNNLYFMVLWISNCVYQTRKIIL